MALLGVKYYVTSSEISDLPDYYVLDDELSSDSRLVWRNKGAYPLASFYDKAISESAYIQMANEEKDAALLSSVVLEDGSSLLGSMSRANVDEVFDSSLLKNATLQHGLVGLVETEMLNEGCYVIETNASNDGVLLVTTPYEKNNWSITIDGVPAEPIRVDCGLLGVAVDSGVHEVRVSYSPRWFGIGAVVSAVCLIGLLLCGALHCLLKMRWSNELGASR